MVGGYIRDGKQKNNKTDGLYTSIKGVCDGNTWDIKFNSLGSSATQKSDIEKTPSIRFRQIKKTAYVWYMDNIIFFVSKGEIGFWCVFVL